ncbi:putative reverse transcriptase domain-containing protein, partial [Tanacetum coccineum]
MEIDIEKYKNEPELTYPYEEVDPLNPPPPASESEPDDEIEVENPIEHEDETVPISFYEDIDSLFGRMVNFSRRLYGRETAHALVEKKGKAKDKFYGKLILDLGNEVRFRVEQGTAAIGKLVECKKLKKELEKARDVFEERPNEAINIPIKDEKSPSSELQGSPQSVDVAIAAERERQVKVRNDASRSGPVRGAVELRRWFEKTESVFRISECVEGKKVRFAAATLEGLTLTWWNYKIVTMGLETVNRMPWTEMKQLTTAEFYPIEEIQRMEHELWNLKVKEYDIVAYTQRFNELALMYNIKGEVTSSKPADLNEAVRMAHKLMEHKSQARNERILEGKKRKWESFQSGNSSGKDNQRINLVRLCRITKSKEICKPWLPLLLMESFLCMNVVLLAMLVSVRLSATSVERLDTSQGHTKNRCPKKVKQEEVREVCGRAYAIKDAKSKGLNVVTSTFMLNNRYAYVLFDSCSDR